MRPHDASSGIVAVMLGASISSAQYADDTRARARALFNEGLDLRKEGKHDAAILKFREADALVSTPKTRLELGRELVATGRLTEGLTILRSVEKVPVDPKDAGKYEPARKEASLLAGDVEARVPRLRLSLAQGVTDLRVDGASASQGDVLVDPGRHEVTATVGDSKWSRVVVINEHAVIAIVIGSAPPPPSSAVDARTLPIALLIAGGAVVVVGGGYALSARSVNRDSDAHCGASIGAPGNTCDGEGMRLRESAGARADIATGLLIAGAALAAAGITVWALTPGERTSVSVSVMPTGAWVSGRF